MNEQMQKLLTPMTGVQGVAGELFQLCAQEQYEQAAERLLELYEGGNPASNLTKFGGRLVLMRLAWTIQNDQTKIERLRKVFAQIHPEERAVFFTCIPKLLETADLAPEIKELIRWLIQNILEIGPDTTEEELMEAMDTFLRAAQQY